MNHKQVMLFAMPNVPHLGQAIADKLGLKLTDIKYVNFADGEVLLKSQKTVRNKDIFIIASTSPPVNQNLMELLIFVDSLKRASSRSITVALSYYGYARQDRKMQGREPIGAKLVADLLTVSGVTKIIAVDLHNPSIQGFFNLPVDDLRGQYIIGEYIKKQSNGIVVVSPDHGGAVRARLLADIINTSEEIAIVDKSRSLIPNKSEIRGILGNVNNKDVVIIDDMIDTGGTIIQASEALKKAGAKRVLVAATHGIFSRGFAEFEKSSTIDQVIVTDSIEKVLTLQSSKLKIVSLDEFISLAIKATYSSTSITKIYSQLRERINKGKSYHENAN